MPEHEDLKADIPAWALSRLAGDDLRRLERHFVVCITCADVAKTARTIAEALGREGEAILTEHPDPVEIARLAGTTATEGDLPRHVQFCHTCILEVRSLRRRRASARQASRRQALRWILPAAGAAAGLLLGLLLAAYWTPPGGAPPAVWLSLVRGGGSAPLVEIGRNDRQVLLMVAAYPSIDAVPPAGVVASVLASDGSEVWSISVPRARVIESLERTEALVLVIPAAALVEGLYEVEMRPLSSTTAAETMRFPFDVVRSP